MGRGLIWYARVKIYLAGHLERLPCGPYLKPEVAKYNLVCKMKSLYTTLLDGQSYP